MSPLPMSASLQDYLEAILNLSRTSNTVRVTDIASKLNLAKASVTQALEMLKEKGLIIRNRYGPVKLTEKGRFYAEMVNYRHKVLVAFLHNVLGLDRPTAERDACLMEHAVSSKTMKYLVAFMLNSGYDEIFYSTKEEPEQG